MAGRGKQAPTNDEESRLARLLNRSSPNLPTTLFMLAAGVTFLVGAGGGLYELVPAVVVAVVGGTLNAWWFLVGVPG